MKHVVMVACLLLTCLLPVNAQRQTSYMIYGEGLTSCGKWLATPPPDDAAMHQWVLGYVTGAHRAMAEWVNAALDADPELSAALKESCRGNRGTRLCQSQIVKDTDAAAVRQWLNNWCQKNPLEDLDDAGYALILELMD